MISDDITSQSSLLQIPFHHYLLGDMSTFATGAPGLNAIYHTKLSYAHSNNKEGARRCLAGIWSIIS